MNDPRERPSPRRGQCLCGEIGDEWSLAGAAAQRLGIGGIRSEADLARLVDAGLPADSLRHLAGYDITDTEIFAVVLRRRTLAHRRSGDQALSREESGRAVRLARITALADRVFGSSAKARLWLRRPKGLVRGQVPIAALGNDLWARVVETRLRQIDHGVIA